MADGSIIIDTRIDNTKAQKELDRLSKSIEKIQTSLSGKKTEQSAIEKEMVEADAAIERTYQNIKRLESELAKMQSVNLKDNTSAQYFAAQTRIPQIEAELQAQNTLMENQGKSADKIAARYEKISGEVKRMNAELGEAQTKAGRLSQQITELGGASTQAAKSTSKASKEVLRFKKRLVELTKSALIFSVITRALTLMRQWLGRAVKANDEAAAAVAGLKGALLGLVAPILNVVIPALAKVITFITQIISLFSRGISALFGTTNKQALESAESLNAEQKALEGVGGAASDAEKSLASFDEINKLSDTSSGGGGGTDSIAASFEEVELPAWMLEVADKLASSFGKLRDVVNKIKSNKALGEIVQFVKDLLILGATIVVESLANALNVLAAALDFIDAVLSGDVIGALEALFDLDWAILELILSPFEALREFLMEKIDASGLSDTGKALAGMFTGRWIYNLINLVTGGWFGKFVDGVKALRFLKDVDLKGWWTESVQPWFTKEKWSKLWNDAKASWENGWEEVRTWWQNSALVTWFNEDVTPWFAKERWQQLWSETKTGFSEGWASVKKWWINSALVVWWKADVAPWFTKEKWQSLWVEVKNGVIQGWQTVKTEWGTAISTWWSENVSPWFTRDKWLSAMSGIKEAFAQAFKNAANAAIDKLNQMIYWVNQKLRFTIPAVSIMGEKLWDARTVTLASIPSIPHLASGAVIPPNREFLAVLGDQKSGTNIEAPLETIKQAFLEAMQESGGAGGGTYTFVVNLDGKEVARNQVKHINEMTRTAGKPVILV